MGILVIYFVSCCCFCILLSIIKFFHKVWWNPIFIQSTMRKQGIKGPPYRFLHGNTKEIADMIKENRSKAMELSHEMFPRIQPHIYSWRKIYGMNFLNWYGHRAQLVVTEPELVKEILSNKNGTYPKYVIQDYAEKLLGNGLLLSQGEKWAKKRKLADHTFHAENLKGMIPAMIASVNAMLERWGSNEVKEIEVFQEFKVLTSEIIARAAFGSSYLEGKNIFDMLMRMGFIVSRNNYKVRIPGLRKLFKTSDDIQSEKLEKGIRDSFIKMIKKREEEAVLGEEYRYGKDFLGILLKAYHNEDETKRITLNDVIDECKSFYVAGNETTASSLSWTLLLLATHSEWQERAREEVFKMFRRQNPSPDDVVRLKTMSMIVNESLRLYPPVFNITREVQREVKLDKLVLPAKMAIALPVLPLHHNPQVWGKDVHLFKPERFADGSAKATKGNVLAFLPFGFGPRSCVGMNFAVAEMKIVLGMILQRYRITLSPTYVHSPVHILTICPQEGLQIMFHPLREVLQESYR